MFKNENTKFTGCIGTLALLGCALTVATIMNGSMLCKWFITPVFGAPSLSILQAIGVAMVLSLLTPGLQSKTNKRKDYTDLIVQYVGKIILYLIIVVAIGWLVSVLL